MTRIRLVNKKWLEKCYNKYQPNLCFLFRREKEKLIPVKNINLAERGIRVDGYPISVYTGQYRVNKKGTRIWDTTGAKPHILIEARWEKDSSRATTGKHNIKRNAILYHRRTPNNGRFGWTYIVIPSNYVNSLTEDDIEGK